MDQTVLFSNKLSRQKDVTLSGIWLFIFIEILLFAGLFVLYGIYRYKNPIAFDLAAQELSITSGLFNTLIIITGSWLMTVTCRSFRKPRKITQITMLVSTLFIGFMFIVNRYYEWMGRIDYGFFPGSETLSQLGQGDTLFFGLYFFMTALHIVHMIIGFIVLTIASVRVNNNTLSHSNPEFINKAGSFWHLGTLIWVLIYPLFYLL